MIKRMLSINKRISRGVSRDNTSWLRRPELEVEKILNWQISRKKEVLMKVMCGLSDKKSREINEL